MSINRRPFLFSFLVSVMALAVSACSSGIVAVSPATPTDGTPLTLTMPSPTSAALSTIAPTVSPPPATSAPTIVVAPTATLSPMPTVAPVPTATPPDPAAGLACPAEPPDKPEYSRGGVGTMPLGQGLPVAARHQLLAGPVAVEGLPRVNRNFPYGSDSNGRYLIHNGLDIVEPRGQMVLAVADGTVIVAGPDAERQFGWRCDWYGHLVVVQLDQEWEGRPVFVLYGHVLDISVSAGDRVQTGDPLAVIGIGGVATAPHLHLEVRVDRNDFGATRNPDLWLAPVDGFGTIAGRLIDPDGRPWQGMTITLIDSSGRSNFVYTWTYLDDPDHLIQPDDDLRENFTFGFVPDGDYQVSALVQGKEYRQSVTVQSGEIAFAEIVTTPYQTPTPNPLSSSTP